LVFSGDYEYNDANNIQMDALEEVLNIKLIERLREQESGVYAPGVRVAIIKIQAAGIASPFILDALRKM
jgi:zinc protease